MRDLARLLLDQIADLSEKIVGLDAELHRRAGTNGYCAAASHHFGHCCDRRSGDHDLRAVDGGIFERVQFRGMGWPDTDATFERR